MELDAVVETVAVLQPPDCARSRAGWHYQFLRAGPVRASWTAPEPFAEPLPLRGALVGGWHGGGPKPQVPRTHGVIKRIRVLRQDIMLDGPRAHLVPEGAQLRDVTTIPKVFASADVPIGSPGHWEEIGIVADIEAHEAP